MDTLWLSYDEIAQQLGITKPSARTLAKRHKWPRRPANDGTARVGIPAEYMNGRPLERPEGRSQGQTPDQPPERSQDRPEERPLDRSPDHDATAVAVLARHIERLEAQLDAAMNRAADRDQIAARCEAITVQVEALRAALDAANQDRDRWHTAATARPPGASRGARSWWPFRRAG